MKYECDQCEKEVDDQGPYETSDGNYMCQECMEQSQAKAEAAYDDWVENQIDEAKIERRLRG
jgi:hypothetical protein